MIGWVSGGLNQVSRELPPGPDLPRERQTARLAMRPLAFLEGLRAEHGDVFALRMTGEAPWIVAANPESVATIFKAPPDVLHAGEGKRVLRPLLGDNSVLLLDEERHLEQRKLLLPPFKGNRIEHYESAMRGAAERAMGDWPLGKATPAAPRTRAIALETILRAVFGTEEDGSLDALRDALEELRLPGNEREGRAPSFEKALARADELISAAIDKRAEADAGETHDDMLSLLLQGRHEDGSPMSRIEVRDELISLLVAGHETTGTTLAWALDQLARNPQALAQVEEEAADGGGPYTDAAIKETLRIRPALPLLARAVKEPFRLGEYLLPAGTVVLPAILLVHHRPELYPEPAAFQPERFLDKPPDSRAWMPFGGGVRRCIGAHFALREMRVVLSTLLARARVRAVGPETEAMRCRNITLTPSRGAPVILEPR